MQSNYAPRVPLSHQVTVSEKLKLLAGLLIVVVIAEMIGSHAFKLGPGKVVLLPMLWALLMSTLWGAGHRLLPKPIGISINLQVYASCLLNIGLLFFIAKLSLTVGGSLPAVYAAGWALFFQEFGHAFGTLALGLPLALILGVKREAIGATFSVGREGSLAIISERFGMSSPEGRGVLAEYITGTVVGALFIAMLAGFITSLNIFDPRSLAMGAGVGSGSMMAAAIGSITAQQPAELHQDLIAIAAAANLLTLVTGFYFNLFLSLPAALWLYDKLEPVIGRFVKNPIDTSEFDLKNAGHDADSQTSQTIRWLDKAGLGVVMAMGVAIGNALAFKVPLQDSVVGLTIILAILWSLDCIKNAWPKIPMVLTLSVVATLFGVPDLFPFSEYAIEAVKKLKFLAFTTPILALAGFAVAKDIPIFRKLGWRIVVVSLTAAAGTFMGATLIAEFFH